MNDTISREEIWQKIESGAPLMLIEALPPRYFDKAHLPGAINIPHDEISRRAAQVLPDRDATIVVYCANTECRNSRIATDVLRSLGYRRVYEYVEGKQHWIEAGLPVERTVSRGAA